MTASAADLNTQLELDTLDIKGALMRAERLSERLVALDNFTAAYAYDHAEEELGWIADELEAAARKLRSLRAYTVTGEARAAAARKSAAQLIEQA